MGAMALTSSSGPLQLGWGLPCSPLLTLPDAHGGEQPPWALILTLRKVPIVHFQSCFKVTLISKLLATPAVIIPALIRGKLCQLLIN